jgi:hypothetical protein
MVRTEVTCASCGRAWTTPILTSGWQTTATGQRYRVLEFPSSAFPGSSGEPRWAQNYTIKLAASAVQANVTVHLLDDWKQPGGAYEVTDAVHLQVAGVPLGQTARINITKTDAFGGSVPVARLNVAASGGIATYAWRIPKEHAAEMTLVRRNRPVGNLNLDGLSVCGLANRTLDDVCEVDRFEMHGNAPRLDRRPVEHGVGQVAQLLRVLRDDVNLLAAEVVVEHGPRPLEQGSGTGHYRDLISQIVGGARDELERLAGSVVFTHRRSARARFGRPSPSPRRHGTARAAGRTRSPQPRRRSSSGTLVYRMCPEISR